MDSVMWLKTTGSTDKPFGKSVNGYEKTERQIER